MPYKQPEPQADVNQYLPPKIPTYLPPKNNDHPIATQKPYRPLVTNPPIYLPPKSPLVTQKPFKPVYLPPKPFTQSNDYAITTHRPTVRTTQRAYLPPTQTPFKPVYLPPKPITQSNDYSITTRRPTVRTTQRIVPTTQRAYLPPNGYLPPN